MAPDLRRGDEMLFLCHSRAGMTRKKQTHPGLRPPLPAGAERPGVGGELVTGFKFSSLGGVRRSREVGYPCSLFVTPALSLVIAWECNDRSIRLR